MTSSHWPLRKADSCFCRFAPVGMQLKALVSWSEPCCRQDSSVPLSPTTLMENALTRPITMSCGLRPAHWTFQSTSRYDAPAFAPDRRPHHSVVFWALLDRDQQGDAPVAAMLRPHLDIGNHWMRWSCQISSATSSHGFTVIVSIL